MQGCFETESLFSDVFLCLLSCYKTMKSRLSAGIRKRNHLSKRLLIIKEEVSWYIMLVTASPVLNWLIIWMCFSQTLFIKHHVYLYIYSGTSAVIITKLLIVKLMYLQKQKNMITCVIPIETYFSLIRKKSHHTLVNIKSHNYEIKGMNYDIQSHNYEI